MVVSNEQVEVTEERMFAPNVIAASPKVLGNGTITDIANIVYVKPDVFEARHTPVILNKIAEMNRGLTDAKLPYLLIGFGRWGSSDPWLGIPVV